MTKPTLCIDFDGVIHRYSNGWQNGVIYDEITDGFLDWAAEAQKYFNLVVYSSRSSDPRLLADMRNWLLGKCTTYMLEHPDVLELDFEFSAEKPAAFITIDDRAIRFDGDWSAPELSVAALQAFKPWNVPH